MSMFCFTKHHQVSVPNQPGIYASFMLRTPCAASIAATHIWPPYPLIWTQNKPPSHLLGHLEKIIWLRTKRDGFQLVGALNTGFMPLSSKVLQRYKDYTHSHSIRRDTVMTETFGRPLRQAIIR